jgi:lipopolysaccharide exporter
VGDVTEPNAPTNADGSADGAAADAGGLKRLIAGGVAWSALSQIALRAGSLVIGIVLARLLTPHQFGVYAVALTVQAVLANLADLGLSADLIRSSDPERRAPVVAVLALVVSSILALGMALSSGLVAEAMGSAEAAPVIALLSVTLVLSGLSVVPYATLLRRFDQKRIFALTLTDFVLSSIITVALIKADVGVMSLAIGRVASQAVTATLMYPLAHVRPRLGLDRGVLADVLRFGIPVAGANSLSWVLLNLDNVVIARSVGPVALGFYVLAFNVSSWPMNVVGAVARSVALPAFARTETGSRTGRRDESLSVGVSVSWPAALLAGGLLALLAGSVVDVLYGSRWAPAAAVLAGLGLFGAVRVVLDLCASYLMARGAGGLTLWVQVWWFVTLLPALVLATHWWGIAGAAWAHLAVSVVLLLPAYLLAVRHVGAALGPVALALVRPLGAAVAATAVVLGCRALVDQPVVQVLIGGLLGAGVFGVIEGPRLRRLLRPRPAEPERESVLVQSA